eukprot:gnl/TRDRNA2_/TRDRNA2_194170_c0_seq1.p1 gnl/TRDRNA2_/TRDRNA2_194170_c0~~gnl/TRDRNA2_/TRDRNA2_194170_c0_seq1.p1  ORF type:complete len:362 (-),score=58.46 gnl/TRDRNA2_/TRDRNA2_194170_c0_seq1:102-1187(-)
MDLLFQCVPGRRRDGARSRSCPAVCSPGRPSSDEGGGTHSVGAQQLLEAVREQREAEDAAIQSLKAELMKREARREVLALEENRVLAEVMKLAQTPSSLLAAGDWQPLPPSVTTRGGVPAQAQPPALDVRQPLALAHEHDVRWAVSTLPRLQSSALDVWGSRGGAPTPPHVQSPALDLWRSRGGAPTLPHVQSPELDVRWNEDESSTLAQTQSLAAAPWPWSPQQADTVADVSLIDLVESGAAVSPQAPAAPAAAGAAAPAAREARLENFFETFEDSLNEALGFARCSWCGKRMPFEMPHLMYHRRTCSGTRADEIRARLPGGASASRRRRRISLVWEAAPPSTPVVERSSILMVTAAGGA